MRKVIRIGIFVVTAACLIVGYYFYLSHIRPANKKEEQPKQTEMEKVLSADFDASYPQTPREVIKWYNRILMLYYDSDTKPKEVEKLCIQAQKLFDDELIKANPSETYIDSVEAEIEEYHAKKKRMVSADVCDTSDVTYKKVDGDDIAYVIGNYFVSENTDYQRTYQKYALRMDEEGRYKILAFELCDEDGRTQ